MSVFKVFYQRSHFFRDGSMGYRWLVEQGMLPAASSLEKSHVFLKEVEAESAEKVFSMMQGEVWSPNGEARPLIRSKGLSHTSMSVGDVLVDEAGKAFLVDSFGFKELLA